MRLLGATEQTQSRREDRIIRSLNDETDRLLRSEVFESGNAPA